MLRYGTLAIVLFAVPGCFLFFPVDENPGGDPTGSSELMKFGSEKELTDYFVDQISGRNDQLGLPRDTNRGDLDAVSEEAPTSGPAPAAPTQGADAAGGAGDDFAAGDGAFNDTQDSFSGTTIQEIGVDEADVVKTDGDYLYIIHDEMLRIVRVSPREDFGVVSTTQLEGYGREIYLHDGMVVALTETYGGYFGFGGGGIAVPEPFLIDEAGLAEDGDTTTVSVDAEPPADDVDVDFVGAEPIPPEEFVFERPSTIVTILDITAPESPVEVTRTRFDGSQSSSRMINGVMRLVVANFQNHFFDVLPMLGRPELDVAQVDQEQLLPTYDQWRGDQTESGTLVTWENLYRPTDPDGFGIVSVVTMDTNDRSGTFSAVGVVAEPGLIYSSMDALYLTDTNWDFFGNERETTDVYKIVYGEVDATPVATGTVKGRILNQYSMGEFDGYLRVATTVSPTFDGSFLQRTERSNSVYILGKEGTRLTVSGMVENIAPGETIQSARFMGDRGYLVTFREVDPLFTLNLASPDAPTIEGELKVPGFSTFIVPIDRDHLLTVGQHIPEDGPFFSRGVQLSVFDVSDFKNPTLKHLEVINGADGSWSEALHNPKAFTFFAEQSLIALPIEIYDYGFPFFDGPAVEEPFFGDDVTVLGEETPSSEPAEPPPDGVSLEEDVAFAPQEFRGLMVFRVSTDVGFEELGRINTDFDNRFYWTAFTRGVFIGDDCFAVTNQGVRGAAVADLATITEEIRFEVPDQPDFVEFPIAGGAATTDVAADPVP